MRGHLLRAAVLVLWCLGVAPASAHAQYFGQNKVQHRNFKFAVLATAHFDIYYYPEETEAAREVARMAERWYVRLSNSLGHQLNGRQPVILYASHPEFEQTNVIEGMIQEGVGGVTESGRRRIVLPMAASLADSHHVLGHELVHAFQYDMLGPQAGAMPLWMIEGMAEYLSIGSRDPQTALWLRDAAYHNRLPTISDLEKPDFFPYRFGHAFWAYVTGRWGDRSMVEIMQFVADSPGPVDPVDAIENVTGLDRKTLSAEWHTAIRQAYDIAVGATPTSNIAGVIIGPRKDRGRLDVGPALSPDGQRIAFLSERGQLSIDLYLADATTGRVIRRLISTASNSHFDSLQFLYSAGAWSPDGRRLAVATLQNGKAAMALFDGESGNRIEEIPFATLGEVFQPAWAPDGQSIAFVGQAGGFTDLYLYTFASRNMRRLTSDAYGDLHPTWSPDGRKLAFVTERFSTDLKTLAIGGFQVATINIADGAATLVGTKQEGNATNPQWSPDGRSIYFVSDMDGRPNVYRADAASGQPVRLTAVSTGVGGVTRNSPAISVAAKQDRMAVTIFRESGYEIHVIDTPSAMPNLEPLEGDLGLLPPTTRTGDLVSAQLSAIEEGLPDPATITEKEYRPRLHLTNVSQGAGVSAGRFGVFASGGIALGFTDDLGEHLLGTSFGINGGVRDIGGSASYVNRTKRWNWGVVAERAPLVSGTAAAGFGVVGGQQVYIEQTQLFRQTVTYVGAMTAYPFSRTSRVEFNGRRQHIGFDREVHTQYFDAFTGEFLGEEREDLPAAASLRLWDVSGAYVRDSSSFGVTGPVLGQRIRLEVAQTSGDLQFTTVSTDLRHYLMPIRPVTLAGRFLHIGRYGAGSEDPRLYPLFLGYPSLVRGYETRTFDASECPADGGPCPAFDRLVGSRIIVLNGEVRAPLLGLFSGRMHYGALPVDLIGFTDAGVAWNSVESPSFAGGGRSWVSSVGVGLRFNLFGVLLGEIDLVRPLNRPIRGVTWVFSLNAGF